MGILLVFGLFTVALYDHCQQLSLYPSTTVRHLAPSNIEPLVNCRILENRAGIHPNFPIQFYIPSSVCHRLKQAVKDAENAHTRTAEIVHTGSSRNIGVMGSTEPHHRKFRILQSDGWACDGAKYFISTKISDVSKSFIAMTVHFLWDLGRTAVLLFFQVGKLLLNAVFIDEGRPYQ